MSHDLTRWIEDADARHFSEEIAFDRRWAQPDHHHHHFGDMIAKVPGWFQALTHAPGPRLRDCR